MKEDENTGRGGPGRPRAATVRTTAPVGTPAPQRMKSDRPIPQATESQPRTVGGHTARLNVDEGAMSAAKADAEKAAAAPIAPAVASPAVASLAVASPAVASPAVAAVAPAVPAPVAVVAPAAPAPVAAAAPAAPAPRPITATAPMEVVPHQPPPTPPVPVTTTAPLPAASIGGATPAPAAVAAGPDLHVWSSPMVVSVGMVFFAVGSMIALAADGRFGGRGHGSTGASTAVPRLP